MAKAKKATGASRTIPLWTDFQDAHRAEIAQELGLDVEEVAFAESVDEERATHTLTGEAA